MNTTGFMPNRGRMVTAGFFAQDLRQDWRYGAHYFEEKLIDHDVCSNYGGWNFSSGTGPGRVLVFNTLLQSQKFDPDGKYIRQWVPELKNVPDSYVHDPWNMPKSLQKSCKIHIGEANPEKGTEGIEYYPRPIECEKYVSEAAAKKIKRPKSGVVAPAKTSNLLDFVAKKNK